MLHAVSLISPQPDGKMQNANGGKLNLSKTYNTMNACSSVGVAVLQFRIFEFSHKVMPLESHDISHRQIGISLDDRETGTRRVCFKKEKIHVRQGADFVL